VRPKHRERLERFQHVAIPDVASALELRDLERLELAHEAATEFANRIHAESGYPYIQVVVPSDPPTGLQLTPVE
jgi:hypothetical protein